MYELIKVTDKCYYMDCPSKVGFYKTSENEVCLIDSGSDKDAAKKVLRHIEANGWKLKAIYCTHSHADHIGGNQYLQTQTGCEIYAAEIEKAYTEFPILEPTTLFGSFPPEGLKNKFLLAKESVVKPLTDDLLPEGLEMVPLHGHTQDMVGYRSDDGVIFLGDCLASAESLDKYKITFIYDIETYLNTLEYVRTLDAKKYIPSHAAETDSIADLAQLNIDKTLETSEYIRKIIVTPKTFDEIMTDIFNELEIRMTIQQFYLIGSTVRSYLIYLVNKEKAAFTFEDNKMLWKAI
ncbi:MAG: MBL fold metallo-hydrolase [Firmicutes bacterium]|nr:MBL fold metallo-hydrolase [Candidatus Colimorpha enterica]